MFDIISTNENLVISKGEGVYPSRPSASPGADAKVNASEGTAVQLSPGIREVTAKQEETSRDEMVEKELKETIQRLNDKLGRLDREVLLKVDERIGRHYVSVIDKESREIIKEFPPAEIRAFIARFMEFNEKMTASTDLRSLILNLEV